MPIKEYDVLIVGSGHSGGMAANILTDKGISCLMLNAGPEADYEKDRAVQTRLRTALSRIQQAGPAAACLSSQRVQRQSVGG